MAASLGGHRRSPIASCKYGSSRRSARARDSSGGIGSAIGFMTGPGVSLARTNVSDPSSACADGSTNQPWSRNPVCSTRMTVFPGLMPASANRPSASVAVAGPPAGRKTRAPATARPCRSLICPVNFWSGWRRMAGIAARSPVERHPVGDKGHEPVVPDGHAVGRTAQQGGWSLKRTLRSCFQRLLDRAGAISSGVSRRLPRASEIARQGTRPLDPEFHRDVGQRLAGCRADDSDHSPWAA